MIEAKVDDGTLGGTKFGPGKALRQRSMVKTSSE